MAILFAAGGFAVGYGFAWAAAKLAYGVLDRGNRAARERYTIGACIYAVLYGFMPLFSCVAAGAATMVLTIAVLRLSRL